MTSGQPVLHPLEYKVGKLIAAERLVRPGTRVLAGVSAGGDSMALLHVLSALAGEYQFTLVAAYVDHGLRPQETPAEWEAVREAAHRLGCSAERVCVDVHGRVSERGESLEQAARQLRYRALRDLAHTWRANVIAIAHTEDDQVEEVLLRLFRGSGGRGLSGMRTRTADLIRPLLGISKAQLLAYLNDKNIFFCHDSSNDDRRFLRNRVRLDLLPYLKNEFDVGIRGALLKTAANLAEDEDFLDTMVAASWPQVVELSEKEDTLSARIQREGFCALHPALQRRLMEKLLWQLESCAAYEQILTLCAFAREAHTGQELHLRRGLRVTATRTELLFSYPRGRGAFRGRLQD